MNINPIIAILLATTLGASSGVFIKLLNLPPTTIAFFRLGVPVFVIFFYLKHKKVKFFRGNYKTMLLASGLNAVRLFLYFVAFLYTSMGNAVIILYTWPIFAAVFSVSFMKEKMTRRDVFLFFLAFFGIVLMYANKDISFQSRDFIGMLAMLASAIFDAIVVLIFKKQFDTYSRTETIFYQNFLGAFIFLPFVFINKPLPTLTQTSVVLVYAFFVGVVAWIFFFSALKKLKVNHYSLLSYWEVIATIVFGIIFFEEVITWNMLFGGSLIIISSLLLKRKETELV